MAVVSQKNPGVTLFRIFNILCLSMLCLAIAYPFLHIVSVSLSSFGPVTRNEVSFFPRELTLEPYKQVFKTNAILVAYKNTIIITVLTTVLGVVTTSFAAYPLSRPNFMARRFFTLAIALTLWFSGGMIPSFLVVRSLGLYNTLAALIIPALISTYNVIIMLTFFKSVPQDLIDAATIDGCNEARILFQIVYPVSKPILATIALWVAVGAWNDFMGPLLYLQDRALYPLQIILRDIVLQGTGHEYGIQVTSSTSMYADANEFMVVEESLKAATVMVSLVPIMCVYPFLQKHFAKGVMIGSIKG